MQPTKTLTLALLAVLLIASIRAAPQADDQAKANRNSLLLRRGNVGRPLGRTTPTTTTSTTASPDYAEDEYADSYDEGKGEDGADDGAEEGAGAGGKQPTTTTTTTEPPKKIRPSIRPFRSNDDLLTALKKRRQESKNSKPAIAPPKEKTYDDEDVPAPAAPPAKPAKAPAIAPNKRRFGSGTARKDDHAADSSNDGHNGDGQGNEGGSSNGAKSLIGRLGRSRFALKQ
ncbi:protein TonB [Anopheles nili]|uniref:protein TonB n=1 Tax=Anopheles nili TaxID=185578 RepID=UPI00237AE03E|nr:protein TonB [Anopheles nili]